MRCRSAAILLAAACGPALGGGESSSSGGEGTSSSHGVAPSDDHETSSTSESSSEGSSSDDASAVSFIIDPDGPPICAYPCDLWSRDCPAGEKCTAWANDGGPSWNDTRCVPVADDPGDLHDPCTVEDSLSSGLDDCKVGAMCLFVDPATNVGKCVGLCQGSEANPTCEDPSASCHIGNDGALTLCIVTCDPLLQDCVEGEACYPIVDAFGCAPDNSGDAGAYGDPCSFLDACDAGSFCANPEDVPGCGGNGCCTPFCDTSDPDAGAGCSDADEGQACVSWYEDGQAPPGFENVGGCMIPQ